MSTLSKLAIAVVLVIILFIGFRWWYWKPDLKDFEEPQAVEAFELLLDGKPFPDEIQRDHAYVVRLRCRPLGRFKNPTDYGITNTIHDVAFDAYHSKRVDTVGLTRAYSTGEGARTRLEILRDGKNIDVTPKPPAAGEDIVQYVAILHAASWEYYSKSTEPLEFVVWIFPPDAPVIAPHEVGEVVQRIIYRKTFTIVD